MFFRTRHCTRVHRLGVQKRAKFGKKGCVYGHKDKFWKEHDGQIKKNACKNAYLGSIFIPEKYVIRVLFVSPWTSLIPPLAIQVPPPPGIVGNHYYCGAKNCLKTSYFGFILTFMEKQSEYLVIGHPFATYGMDLQSWISQILKIAYFGWF